MGRQCEGGMSVNARKGDEAILRFTNLRKGTSEHKKEIKTHKFLFTLQKPMAETNSQF